MSTVCTALFLISKHVRASKVGHHGSKVEQPISNVCGVQGTSLEYAGVAVSGIVLPRLNIVVGVGGGG